MHSADSFQIRELPNLLVEPACKDSETLWLYFLLTTMYGPAEVVQHLPKPKEYSLYDDKNLQTHRVIGIAKEPKIARSMIQNKISFGKQTMLCLTGDFSGAICKTSSCNSDDTWNVVCKTEADIVPLRMIRRAYIVRPHWKEKFKNMFGFAVSDDSGSGWFPEILISLLSELQWPMDAAQIESNAVDAHYTAI